MPHGKSRFSLVGVIALIFIAVSLPFSVYLTRTRKTEIRSKARGPTRSVRFPVTEIGRVRFSGAVGDRRLPKSLAQSSGRVLGEQDQSTPSATPSPTSSQDLPLVYVLKTDDGRIYNLEKRNIQCPDTGIGEECSIHLPIPEINQYEGRTVLVTGSLRWPAICHYPPESDVCDWNPEPLTDAWWPLPHPQYYLTFEVDQIEEVTPVVADYTSPADTLQMFSEVIPHHLYQFTSLNPCQLFSNTCIEDKGNPLLVRSSFEDFSPFIGQVAAMRGNVWKTTVSSYYVINAQYIVPESSPNPTVTPTPTPTPSLPPQRPPNPPPVTIKPACLPGDINKDGTVDPGDYTLLFDDFFKTKENDPVSDINADGIVDVSDYTLLVQSFGKSTGPCVGYQQISGGKKSFNLSQLIPSVVTVECFNAYGSLGQGSGSSVSVNGQHRIRTNAHVVNGADACWVYFPRKDGSFYESAYLSRDIASYDDETSRVEGETVKGIDFAELFITEAGKRPDGSPYPFPTKFPDLYTYVYPNCRTANPSLDVGDRLYIMGYPTIGHETITITEGVVSGFEEKFNQWIKTSAKFSFGNSGGVAIHEQGACVAGIPTWVEGDSYASVGRILSNTFITKFLKNFVP